MPRSSPTNNVSSFFENQRADYSATKQSRFQRRRRGLAAGGAGGDYHIRNESQYYELMEQARDLDRNDSIVGQVINRAVAHTVQDGFQFLPETGDPALDTELYYLWEDWSTDPDQCDISGEQTFKEFESAAMRSTLLDGDCVIKALDNGALEFHEGHEVGTSTRQKNTVLGVTQDTNRRRTHYWIGDGQNGSRGRSKEKSEQYATRDSDGLRLIFHVHNKSRTTLTRGITAFAPIFDVAGMIEDINFAKLVQQQIVSCFAIIRERSADTSHRLPSVGGNIGEGEYGPQHTERADHNTQRLIDDIQPGLEIMGDPGEVLKGFSPNVPNAEFFEQFWLQISMVGANLGLAPCQVLLDFHRETFVGYRGALHEARKGMRANQNCLRRRFHSPAYRWKLTQFAADDPAIMAAAERLGPKFFKHKVQPPAFDYLEPVNDAAADLLRIRNGLTSRRRQCAERSQDWEEIAEESVDDNAFAIQLALKKADEFRRLFPNEPDPPHWRDFISMPTPDGIQVGLTNNQSGESNAATTNTSQAEPARRAPTTNE